MCRYLCLEGERMCHQLRSTKPGVGLSSQPYDSNDIFFIPWTHSALAAGHEDQTFEQMHILLVLEQRAVQRWNNFVLVLAN